MALNKLSNSDWEEWQQSAVTQAVRDALQTSLSAQVAAAKDAYMSGKPWPETDRAALVRVMAWHEDFFDATFDEITAAIEAER